MEQLPHIPLLVKLSILHSTPPSPPLHMEHQQSMVQQMTDQKPHKEQEWRGEPNRLRREVQQRHLKSQNLLYVQQDRQQVHGVHYQHQKDLILIRYVNLHFEGRERKCFFTNIHLDLFRSHLSIC